jgi:hypothetical protein
MPVTANSIITPQTPRSAAVVVSTAQTNFPPTTTPSNTVLLVTAGPNGGRLTRLTALPHETTGGAGVMQAFRDVGTTGANKFLFATAVCATDTVSATDPPVGLDFGYSDDNPLLLQASERIYVATGIAKTVCFTAEWADY